MNNHKIDSDNTTIDYREGANDHFAAIIMLLLASHNELVLTGGFAIKTLYASKRPTKDLDYRARVNNPDAACIVEGVLSDLDHFGVDCVMVDKNSNQYRDRLFLQYTFPTIRYSSVLQIDIAKYDALHLETWSRTVTSIYDDMVNFQVALLAPVYQMAEKVCAFLCSGKPTHLYDISLLHKYGIVMNKELVKDKLALRNLPLEAPLFHNAINKAASLWKSEPAFSSNKLGGFADMTDALSLMDQLVLDR